MLATNLLLLSTAAIAQVFLPVNALGLCKSQRASSVRTAICVDAIANNEDGGQAAKEHGKGGERTSLLPSSPLLPSPSLSSSSPRRRNLISHAASATMGTFTASLLTSTSTPTAPQEQVIPNNCSCCPSQLYRKLSLQQSPIILPPSANALVEIKTTDLVGQSSSSYDLPRNKGMDKFFSYAMSTTMDDYEAKARPYKTKLFQTLFDPLLQTRENVSSNNENDLPVIVEVGMGTFPNAPYYAQAIAANVNNRGLDIVGVDPNDSMFDYAKDSATKSGLLTSNSNNNNNVISLRNVHGVAEALPFPNDSVDAIVGTLTLCSVTDQSRALSEIQRVLKPKTGKFLFWEHVLSEKDAGLALQQQILSPIQTIVADGCHLNRRTGMTIQNAGFGGGVEMEYILLDGNGIISPTVFGIATA